MNWISGNLFHNLPCAKDQEVIQTLLSHSTVRIERIVSQGQSAPETGWFDQAHDEWVLLVEGRALIRFHNQTEPVQLKTGDYLFIPAHVKHRVEWTPPYQLTVWLAIHIEHDPALRNPDEISAVSKS